MPQNFSFQKENGIYIKSFFGVENDDTALYDLIPILKGKFYNLINNKLLLKVGAM